MSLPITFLAAVAALFLTLALFPEDQTGPIAAKAPRSEIFLRMAAATALVLGLTGMAAWLGPSLTGLIAPFPVYSTILAAFTQRAEGGEAAARLLRGVVLGSFTFALFFFAPGRRPATLQYRGGVRLGVPRRPDPAWLPAFAPPGRTDIGRSLT